MNKPTVYFLPKTKKEAVKGLSSSKIEDLAFVLCISTGCVVYVKPEKNSVAA